jgi:hypothetical protein
VAEDVLYEVLPESRLHEVVLQPGSLPPPVVPTLLHLPPRPLPVVADGQVLGHLVLQSVVVDLLGYPEDWAVLAVVAEPGRSFLGLREHVVSPLVEVALEEKVGLLLLPRLAHQFQHLRLLLAVEVGRQRARVVDVAQRHAALT